MRANLYVALSGQVALEKRLDTIASNIANVNTAGYRAQGVAFSSVLSKVQDRPSSFVTTGTEYLSRAQGTMTKTDNPLDVAVQGDGFFAVRTPAGVAYTRDGRLQISASGELQTLNGYPVLDAGRGTLLLDATQGAPVITNDGMITQNGRQVGALGLFAIPEDAKLTRYDNSAVVPDKEPAAVLDFSTNGVEQGFVEGSNINPVLEITKLIDIQRAYDGLASITQSSESSLQDAVKTLGSNASS